VGFYGMNFKWMPGLEHPYGWIFTLGGMGTIIAGMMGFFKYKKWW
jgi:magnesium transporter